MFKPGDRLKATGLNTQCETVETVVIFVRYLPETTDTGFDCSVLCEDGLKVLSRSSELRA